MTGPERAEQRPKPKSRRHLATWLVGGFGLVLFIAGVVVSFITGTPFSWAAFLLIGGIVVLLFAGFVWIRLADES